MATQQLVVSGKVQGVGFRDWVTRQARENGITGWVRNLKDGRVEILANGEDESLAILIDIIREGPPMARIDHVDANPAQSRGEKGFTKRFTA